MDFAVSQIQNEISNLSNSIDEMKEFYTNDTDEETINVTEILFDVAKRMNNIFLVDNTNVKINCCALGDVEIQDYADFTPTFSVRCGTGVKKCFYDCHKGNIIVYGDKDKYRYLVRSLMAVESLVDYIDKKNILIDIFSEEEYLCIKFTYDFVPLNVNSKLEYLQGIFNNYFEGSLTLNISADSVDVTLIFKDSKIKNAI
jgi:hypothetical protein